MYAGQPAEGAHFKPGVVGKAVESVVFVHIAGLYEGVALERVGRFGYVGMATYVGKAEHFYLAAQNGAYLVQLVGVVGGEYEFFHRLFGNFSVLPCEYNVFFREFLVRVSKIAKGGRRGKRKRTFTNLAVPNRITCCTKKEKAAPERRFGTVIKKTSGNRAKISLTYFKIQGTYFKICALYFPFSPRGS